MAFELITVLIVLAAILVALRPGVLLNSVYAFAEIMNMQSIRESLDNEDPPMEKPVPGPSSCWT